MTVVNPLLRSIDSLQSLLIKVRSREGLDGYFSQFEEIEGSLRDCADRTSAPHASPYVEEKKTFVILFVTFINNGFCWENACRALKDGKKPRYSILALCSAKSKDVSSLGVRRGLG